MRISYGTHEDGQKPLWSFLPMTLVVWVSCWALHRGANDTHLAQGSEMLKEDVEEVLTGAASHQGGESS